MKGDRSKYCYWKVINIFIIKKFSFVCFSFVFCIIKIGLILLERL